MEPVLHNPDGTVFEGVFDPETMRIIEHYHSDDGSIIENVVLPKLAQAPM